MTTLRADLLEQAVGAAQAGQRLTARGLLETVLADDPRDVVALLWLSGVVEEPAEQAATLERVLAVEPSNARAVYGLQWLHEHHPEVWLPPAAPIPQPTPLEQRDVAFEPARAVPHETPEGFDDSDLVTGKARAVEANDATDRLPSMPVTVDLSPIEEELRCPYCGVPADAEAIVCSGCQRSLVVDEERRHGRRVARVILAFMALLVTAAALAGSIWLLQVATQLSANALEIVSGIGLGLLGVALLSFVAMLGMFRRWRGMYVLDLLLTSAGIGGLIVALLIGLNLISSILTLPVVLSVSDMFVFTVVVGTSLLLLVLRFGLLLGARREFFPRRGRVRLPVQPLTGSEHFKLGARYRDHGWHWAATRELERAVADEPHKLKYRRALADAYGKIGDLARARDELRASVNLNPNTSPEARAGALVKESIIKEVERERQ